MIKTYKKRQGAKDRKTIFDALAKIYYGLIINLFFAFVNGLKGVFKNFFRIFLILVSNNKILKNRKNRLTTYLWSDII